jgi:hypothetical protein
MKKNEMRVVDSTFDRMQARRGLTAKNASQMSKLIPMLQTASKSGPDDTQKIVHLEDRIVALNVLHRTFVEATRRLATAHKVSRERQLKRFTEALNFIKEVRADGVPLGTSKALRACANEYTSLREIAFINELDESTLDLSATTALPLLLDKLVLRARTQLQQLHDRQANGGEDIDPLFSQSMEDTIARMRDVTEPKIDGQDFVVIQTSVIPVTKGGISFDVLKSRGFDVANLAGYAVLENQTVLGINPRQISLTAKERESGASLPRERWQEVAERVRKAICKETRQRYAFVFDRAHGHAGGAWFWLMTEAELQNFAYAFPGRSLQLLSWGFCTPGS